MVRPRKTVGAVLLAITVVSCNDRSAQQKEPAQPVVTPPVTPSPSDQDLRDAPPSPQWKPGDPVREVPDLRQSPPESVTGSAPVKPDVVEGNLRATQTWRSLYDGDAKRWVLSRWSGFHFYIAISRSPHPTAGGWYFYDFRLPLDRDDSSLALSDHSYVLRIDQGNGPVVFAFDRTRMLEGAPAAYTRTLPVATGPH